MILGMPVLLPAASAVAAPFSLSGSWDNSLDGWTSGGGSYEFNDSVVRTGSHSLKIFAEDWVDYNIAGDMANGLTISASVYHKKQGGGSPPRSLQYRLGTGSFVTLDSYSGSSTSWLQLAGSFLADGQDVTIRVRTDDAVVINFDDWSIEGAVP